MAIEIKCTQDEKAKIIEALEGMEKTCLFPEKAKTCFKSDDFSCEKCLAREIKWSCDE